MKTALLCALAPRPKLLFMDELFTGMDALVKDEITRGLLDTVGMSRTSFGWLRTLLSTLGVIIGVGALVSVLSLGAGMEHFVRSELARKTDVQTVTVSSRGLRLAHCRQSGTGPSYPRSKG